MAKKKKSFTDKINTLALSVATFMIFGENVRICGSTPVCPLPWKTYVGGIYCYALINTSMKHEEAVTYCRETFQADLVQPLTTLENVYIAESVLIKNADIWIGVKRYSSEWRYITSTELIDGNLWENGQEPSSNDCTVLHHDGPDRIYWHSAPCSGKGHNFVCQKIFSDPAEGLTTDLIPTTDESTIAIETTTALTTTTKTTTETDDTSTSNLCICPCNTASAMTQEELQQFIENIKTSLAVKKSTLSSTQRRLTSADDPRTSSRYIGILGGTIIGGVLSLFLLLDILSLIQSSVLW